MYTPRTYRDKMGGERFRWFTVVHLETDLWIAVDQESYRPSLPDDVLKKILSLRKDVEAEAARDKKFLTSHKPLPENSKASELVRSMLKAGISANVGPMAAVAGAFAERVGRFLIEENGAREVIVENGGDIYINSRQPMDIAVFAGDSPLSQKIGVRIASEFFPLGVCTSSGTIGHSFSYGKADAVMIACKDTALSDAFATYFCNKVQTEKDIETVLEEAQGHPEILSIVVVLGDKMGIRGKFPLQIIS